MISLYWTRPQSQLLQLNKGVDKDEADEGLCGTPHLQPITVLGPSRAPASIPQSSNPHSDLISFHVSKNMAPR